MAYLKALVCKALFREFSHFAALSENIIDISFFEYGLHNRVGALNEVLKKEIELIDSGEDLHTSYPPYGLPFEGILIGYGLCSNGVVGLSSQHYPLVIPRAHDCITLLLGSKERYDTLFHDQPGTYWLSPGWVECERIPGTKEREFFLRRYADKYDEETAEMLADMGEEWIKAYTRLAVIEWPEFAGSGFAEATKKLARESAEYSSLAYEELKGNSKLLQDFLSGNWDEEHFLVVPPGKTVKASYDEGVITY
ncbi:MAG: DUF1638 domain-containing protein [Coriobacteriia bacterium]|nr:DUF1638 domain-containing protein [Coriobacteriia bacterium]MCL2749994.1 DUF1638 domain-containing protein [Coriobacteriia bacterium]